MCVCVCMHTPVCICVKIVAKWNAFPIQDTDAVWAGLMKVNVSGYAIWASVCARVCAHVVLMFWMSIGGKSCDENPAELR